ncbi:hypothetical protein V8F20_010515 [Naviculisporaceae sp. PSN 640]
MDFEARRQARQDALRELNVACETGDLDKIQAMLKLPPETRAQQYWQFLTAEDARDCLIWMIDEDDLVVSRCFLELGPGLVDLHEKPIAILKKVKSHAMIQLLAESGFNFKEYGHNILHKFLTPRSTLSYLLDLGADPNRPIEHSLFHTLKRGEVDETCQSLNEAAAQGSIETFSYLVSRGADPRKSIALHRAARCVSDPETARKMVEYLVDTHGFDPNSDDECGGLRRVMTVTRGEEGTPLEYAMAHQNLAAAKALVAKGADWKLVKGSESRRQAVMDFVRIAMDSNGVDIDYAI